MKKRGGFTLVEILVVLIIVSILAAMISAAVVSALRGSKRKASEATARTLEAAAERYKNGFAVLPPTDLSKMFRNTPSPNPTNTGIEALVACLSTTRKGGPFYQPPSEAKGFVNADGDTVGKVPTDPYYKTTALLEYADSWGNPFVYVFSKDYASSVQVMLLGGAKATWKVPLLGTTKSFPNAFGCVIVSAGPDGVLGTDDDVKNY